MPDRKIHVRQGLFIFLSGIFLFVWRFYFRFDPKVTVIETRFPVSGQEGISLSFLSLSASFLFSMAT